MKYCLLTIHENQKNKFEDSRKIGSNDCPRFHIAQITYLLKFVLNDQKKIFDLSIEVNVPNYPSLTT